MATITEKLAETVPDRGVKIAYGEKVMVGGTEMVPVAFVSYGFGGGSMGGKGSMGSERDADMTSDGAGGGGVSIPVGAYIGDAQGLRFHPNPITSAWVSIPLIAVLGWAISKIVRAAS
jgi:uncharacterized spore protein YtfJ